MPTINSGSYTILSLDIQTSAIITQTCGTILINGSMGTISGNYNQSGGYFFIDNKPVTVNTGGQINLSGSATFRMAKDLSSNPQQILTINGSLVQNGGTLAAKDFIIGSGANYTFSGTV